MNLQFYERKSRERRLVFNCPDLSVTNGAVGRTGSSDVLCAASGRYFHLSRVEAAVGPSILNPSEGT